MKEKLTSKKLKIGNKVICINPDSLDIFGEKEYEIINIKLGLLGNDMIKFKEFTLWFNEIDFKEVQFES